MFSFGFGGLTLGSRGCGGYGGMSFGFAGGYGCGGSFGGLTLGLSSLFSGCGYGGYGGSFGLGGLGSGFNIDFGNWGGNNFFNMNSYSSIPGFSSYSNFGTSPLGTYSNFGMNSGFCGFGPSAGFNMGYSDFAGYKSFGMSNWNSYGPFSSYQDFYTTSYPALKSPCCSHSSSKQDSLDTPQRENSPVDSQENTITKFYESNGSSDQQANMKRYISGAKNLASVEIGALDTDGDWRLSQNEFVNGFAQKLEKKISSSSGESSTTLSQQQIDNAKAEFRAIFNALDINNDKSLDQNEYANYLSYSDALDDKQDGQISSKKQSALFSVLSSDSEKARTHQAGLTNWYNELFPSDS